MRKRWCRRGLSARWLLVAAVILCLLGLWSWYASRPALVWQVGPVIDPSGPRARVLVPAGWEAHSVDPLSWKVYAKDFQPAPPSGPVEWLLRLGLAHHPLPAHVVVEAWTRDADLEFERSLDGREHVFNQDNGGTRYFAATRAIRLGELRASVTVQCADRGTYDALHSAICNSLRIE